MTLGSGGLRKKSQYTFIPGTFHKMQWHREFIEHPGRGYANDRWGGSRVGERKGSLTFPGDGCCCHSSASAASALLWPSFLWSGSQCPVLSSLLDIHMGSRAVPALAKAPGGRGKSTILSVPLAPLMHCLVQCCTAQLLWLGRGNADLVLQQTLPAGWILAPPHSWCPGWVSPLPYPSYTTFKMCTPNLEQVERLYRKIWRCSPLLKYSKVFVASGPDVTQTSLWPALVCNQPEFYLCFVWQNNHKFANQ